MISNQMKRTIQLLVMAALPAMSQVAEAGQFFDFRTPAQTSGKAGQAVSPAFTRPGQGSVFDRWGWGSLFDHITGLRIAGVHDLVRSFWLSKYSVPNPAGLQTLTQTCKTEFRNPSTSVIVYQTPNLVLASGLFNPVWTTVNSGCQFTPFNQAANPRGLLAEGVFVWTTVNKVTLRVMDAGTGLVKWTAAIAPIVALGDLDFGQFVDVNGDGTDELELTYSKNVTPVGYIGFKWQITRVVRNGVTGAVLSQVSWVDTHPG